MNIDEITDQISKLWESIEFLKEINVSHQQISRFII